MISPAIRRSSTSQQMKPKILIVDDEPDVVQLIEYNLKSAGYDVMTSTDGQDALQQARASSPDLIILESRREDVGRRVAERVGNQQDRALDREDGG